MADETPVETGSTQAVPGPTPLQQFAAPRQRVVDEHMFRLPPGAGWSATFRVQVFTAAGQRPVVVATQTPEEGASLTNAVEACVAAVWEAYCPGEELPPLWVQRQLYGEGLEIGELIEIVTFGKARPFELSGPQWWTITAAELDGLLGGPVETDRGSGYVPPEPEPEPEARFEVMSVWRLSKPHPFRVRECMPDGTPWWRRWLRQAVPVRGARDCCWYHGGDWHEASRLAIEILTQALRQDIPAEDMVGFADTYALKAGTGQWIREALESLFNVATAVQPSSAGGYTNGQHRSEAMIAAGVRRTVVLRYEWAT
ncbi:hypothetical protein ACFW1A_18505 [Kitasatospora sp. NPDC058965]|uniref:hypothetical protein n=1 Tax=Kitasatospora sp. NPDC058965 TaxID=3346682 RepID=UPI0036B59FFA